MTTLPALRKPYPGLTPYAAPADRATYLRLDANEGPSPSLEHLSSLMALSAFSLTLYPEYGPLKRAAAQAWGLAPEQVLPVNGADEGIALALRAFTGPGEALLACEPTFPMYRIYAEVGEAPLVSVPLRADFTLDLEGLLAALPRCRMLVLASPDNPSGRRVSEADLRTLLEAAGDRPVLLDETYAPFCGQDFTRLLVSFPNLLLLRTLSKAHGVPGLRCGFLLGEARLIAGLDVLRSPYNVNGLAASLGAQLLTGDVGFRGRVARAVAAREGLQATLTARGFASVPSDTHFFLLRLGALAPEVVAGLRRKGILVKDLDRKLPGMMRVSVVSEADAQAFLEALDALEVRP